MTLPQSREQTLQPGSPIPAALVNAIQDGEIANYNRSVKRKIVIPFDGRVRVISGSASWVGGLLISTADADAYHIGVEGLWAGQGQGNYINRVRARINQVGADELLLALWENDDTLSPQQGTSIASIQSGATPGVKWVTLDGLSVEILEGYSWYIRLDHVGSTPTNIEMSVIEIFMGDS